MYIEKKIIPYCTYKIKVSEIHTLYVEECGNPEGVPIVFLHGGPGGRVGNMSRQFFDMDYYRVILFDQRGCGQSTPFAEIKENTIMDLSADMEKIRQYLGIDKWHVFGGSFGSTLALYYAINNPSKVRSLILRGIFLGRYEDIRWLYQEGASYYYPDSFEVYKNFLPKEADGDIISAYYNILTGDDEENMKKAAKHWSNWEMSLVFLKQRKDLINDIVEPEDISLAKLECHYFFNDMFWDDDNYILNNVDKIQDIPMYIAHGRYDIDCRPIGAFELHKACKNSILNLVDEAGHASTEDGIFKALVDFTNEIKNKKI